MCAHFIGLSFARISTQPRMLALSSGKLGTILFCTTSPEISVLSGSTVNQLVALRVRLSHPEKPRGHAAQVERNFFFKRDVRRAKFHARQQLLHLRRPAAEHLHKLH